MENDNRTIVHLIGNAHIDPVWLWKYSAGVTEALATCYTAAELLDLYPDFIFTRADAWVHEQIELFDPPLFDRINAHVKAGRWEPAGGWFVQPDCNFPVEDSFYAQTRIGGRYFREAFGVDVRTGFNVDSFGHTAYLPKFLGKAGFDSYIFMRPMSHERDLPSELFHWNSPDGHTILTWRIQRSYNAGDPEDLRGNIEASLAAAVPGIPHVLCFYGVGDHGGGPTRKLIEWIVEHRDEYEDAELRFSSPSRFFEAVRRHHAAVEALPSVTGELQYHAVGCYSVLSSFKRRLRRSELRGIEAEEYRRSFPERSSPDDSARNDAMWKPVLLNLFHDTAGGTCISESYDDGTDQLGKAATIAEEMIQENCYGYLTALPASDTQRIVVFNPTDYDFEGPISHEPWLKWGAFSGTLVSESGAVPYQRSRQSALSGDERLLTWIADIRAHTATEYRLENGSAGHDEAVGTKAAPGWDVTPRDGGSHLIGIRRSGENPIECNIALDVLEDTSDTWSHGIAGFTGERLASFVVDRTEMEETGPVRFSLRIDASYGRSRLSLWARWYPTYPALDLVFRIDWIEEFSIAKLRFTQPEGFNRRTDGVPGGFLSRSQDGKEYPMRDWTALLNPRGEGLRVVTPDCFACDGSSAEVRVTLLRSAPYAWHNPYKLAPEYPYKITDRGEHTIRFSLLPSGDPPTLDRTARFLHTPPRAFDWTRGMRDEP